MPDNVALSWNTAALDAVRQLRMGPPIVARALHVLHAAIYDAWAAHHDHALGSRLGDLRRRPPPERTSQARREAASFAAHRALVDLFPTQVDAFAKLMGELGYDPDAVGPEGSPSAVGAEAAAAVLAFRHGDGANQLGDLGPEPGGPAAAYADWTGYRPATRWPGWSTPTAGSRCPPPTGSGSASWSPTGAWSPRSPWRPAGSCGRGWGRGATPGAATPSRPRRSWPTAPG